MIQERVIIRMHCDTKHCVSMTAVEADTHEAANLVFYEAGWRMIGSTDRQLCPSCVVRRAKRRKQ